MASGPLPVTELRAAVVIGSGSASFEMLRHLVEVLPVMTTPRWVETRVQPIAVRDVLVYLAGVLCRVIVPVPVLSPRLSSLWVGLVTPIPARLARPLIDSLVNEVVVHDHAIEDVVPHRPIGCRAAIELAMRRVAGVAGGPAEAGLQVRTAARTGTRWHCSTGTSSGRSPESSNGEPLGPAPRSPIVGVRRTRRRAQACGTG